MTTPRKYPPELKDRAVRLVLEAQKAGESLSMNAAAVRIAPRVGVNKDTLYGCASKRSSTLESGQG